MSSAGCQIHPIDVNFYWQKSLEIFHKNSADKIKSKKNKGMKNKLSLGFIQSFRVIHINKIK